MDSHKRNIEEALQTLAKLELLLKMLGIKDIRDLDELTDDLWIKWKAYYDDSK